MYEMNETIARAVKLVRQHEYDIAAIQDMQFMIDTIPKSALSLIDKQAPQRIQKLKIKVQDYIQRMNEEGKVFTAGHYLFLMLIVNSLIKDDHTNIFTNEIKDSKLHYGRFLATYEQGKVRVVQSVDPNIQVNSCITKVNGIQVMKILQQFVQWASPSTENTEVNYRRASAYLGVYNPFVPVNTIQLESGKLINIKYVQAKRGLFGRKSLQSQLFKIIYERSKDDPLGVYSLEDAGILYFDLHTFSAQNSDLQQVAFSVKGVQLPWVKWIVLDMRNNFGGSLVILNQIIKYMYGDQLLKQLQKCTQNHYIANDTFLKQYYEEVILPVLTDSTQSQYTKKIYKDIYKLLKSNKNQGEFCDNKPPKSLCERDILSKIQNKVARNVINGKLDKKIIIITDSHCYSACVWTSKFLARMPNSLLIGKGVSNTKFSGNAIHFELPSGKGSIALPQVLSQLHNTQLQDAVKNEIEPDYILTSQQLKNRKWLIVMLLKNQQILEEKIQEKCIRFTKRDR